jgi:hypothetical protein
MAAASSLLLRECSTRRSYSWALHDTIKIDPAGGKKTGNNEAKRPTRKPDVCGTHLISSFGI